MASTPALQIEAAARQSLLATLRAVVPDFWALTKPEVNFLIVIATLTGFYLGCPSNLHPFPFARLFSTLLGTLLVASGTGTLTHEDWMAKPMRLCPGACPLRPGTAPNPDPLAARRRRCRPAAQPGHDAA
jgi:hypothetical protein